MQTERSKYIRRYLRSISNKATSSKLYHSYHYYIGDMHIRFSDHFSERNPDINIDIIKSNEFYIFKLDGFSYTVYSQDALAYLRSLLIVGPEFLKKFNEQRDVIRTFEHFKNKINSIDIDAVINAKQQSDIIISQKDNTINQLRARVKELESVQKTVLEQRAKINILEEKQRKLKQKLTNITNEL